jgi:NitT/TauT family transport system ATP-binding protein
MSQASAPCVSSAISLRNVSKTFGGPGGVQALTNISCEIGDCEFVSILGPSGCGKSTVLRIMAGLLTYEGDSVQVAGHDVDGPVDEAGVVFQTSNLLPWRNVVGNLKLGLEVGKHVAKPGDLEQDLQRMLKTLGLTDFAKAYPHELSGGMKQRVAIGQALMTRPSVLLMDEPFGALDALTRDHLNVELLRIWQAERKTVVLVTHSIAESIFLSDRVLVMSERPGRFIEDVAIDLPRPRDPTITRQDPRFGEYVVRLSRIMGIV